MAELSCDADKLKDVAKKLDSTRRTLATSAGATQRTARKVRQNRTLSDLGYDAMITDAQQHLNKFAKHVGKLADTALLVAGSFEEYESKVASAMEGGASKFATGGMSTGGSVAKAWAKGATHIFGIGATGSVSGELLKGEASFTPDGKFSLEDGEAYVGVSGKASGSVFHGKGQVDYGLYHAEGEVKYITGAVEGTASASLFRNGVFDPSLNVGAKAEASVLEAGVAKRIGTESYNVHGEAKGQVLTASAEAKAHAGKEGFGATVGAEAAVAKGEIWAGGTIMGIKVDVGAEGSYLSAGAKAGFGVDTQEQVVEGEIGGALGLGAGVKVRVDYSGFGKGLKETIDWWNGLGNKKKK